MENFTINQKLILDYSLNLTQYSVLWAVCRSFADAEPTCVIEGRKYYALNYTKIVEFCAAAQISSSSAPKIVEFLVSRGLLDKKKCSRKFVFTELCKFAKFATNEYEIILVDCSNSIILDNDLVTTEPSNTIITSYNSITINNAPARIYSETNQSSEVFNNTKGEKVKFAKSANFANLQNSTKFPSKKMFTLWDEVSREKCEQFGMKHIAVEWGRSMIDRNALKNVYNRHLDTIYRNIDKNGFSPSENAKNGVLFYYEFKQLFESYFQYGVSKSYMVRGERKYPYPFTPNKLQYAYLEVIASATHLQSADVEIDLSLL